MSLLAGTTSISRFQCLGPVPSESDRNDGLNQNAFRPFQDGLEEERMGWCDWRNPMLNPDPNFTDQERFWVFGLRIDTRRVPAEVLRARVELRLQDLQKEKDLAFVGKEARLSLQDEIKAELLTKIFPSMKTFHVAWDFKGGRVITSATSSKAQSDLIGLFIKSFGIELQLIAPLVLAGHVAPHISTESLMAMDPLDLVVEGAE